jgi:hypothetical protein
VRYDEPRSVAYAVEGAVNHLQRVLQVSPSAAREAIAAVNWIADGGRVDKLARTWAEVEGTPGVAAKMAIDASIIQAAQDYDLPQLAAALRCAARTNSVSPTVRVGADFLARQSLVGGAIGAGWLRDPASSANPETMASARATAALTKCLIDLGDRLTLDRTDLR